MAAAIATATGLLARLPRLRASGVLGTCMTAFWCVQSLAQSVTSESNTELSKETENPVTRRVTVPLRYEGDFNDRPYGATKDTYRPAARYPQALDTPTSHIGFRCVLPET